MKKLFDKDEVTFALIWIGVYVLAFGNADSISEQLGTPKLITVPVGLLLSGVLLWFIAKHSLKDYLGLKPFRGTGRSVMYFLPLTVISTVNFWGGIRPEQNGMEVALHVVSMCCVAFLEEVIFRGLLLRGMCRSGVKMAVAVSSLTFGMGHIVNLLFGAPLLETLLQLVYASAIGFCYTAVVLVGGSLVPCILSHAVVNSTSILASDLSHGALAVTAAVQTVLGVGYGLWLLRKKTAQQR